MEWYFRVLRKYAVFAERARRKEYWMFVLISAVVVLVLGFINGPLMGGRHPGASTGVQLGRVASGHCSDCSASSRHRPQRMVAPDLAGTNRGRHRVLGVHGNPGQRDGEQVRRESESCRGRLIQGLSLVEGGRGS